MLLHLSLFSLSQLHEDQIHLETEAHQAAILRYQQQSANVVSLGRGTNLKPAQTMLLSWYEPLVEAITKEREMLKKSTLIYDRTSHAPYILELDPPELSCIVMHEMFGMALLQPSGVRFVNACLKVGRAVNFEVKMTQLRKSKSQWRQLMVTMGANTDTSSSSSSSSSTASSSSKSSIKPSSKPSSSPSSTTSPSSSASPTSDTSSTHSSLLSSRGERDLLSLIRPHLYLNFTRLYPHISTEWLSDTDCDQVVKALISQLRSQDRHVSVRMLVDMAVEKIKQRIEDVVEMGNKSQTVRFKLSHIYRYNSFSSSLYYDVV